MVFMRIFSRAVLAGVTGLAALSGYAAFAAGRDEHAAPAVRQVLPGPVSSGVRVQPEDAGEIERFCSNIADAARDRRYALQAQELETLRADVDKRIAQLEQKRQEYEDWLKRREVFLARAQDNVVDIYGKMKPDAAAERLSALNIEMAAAILMKLDARRSSTILNEMEKKAAASITAIMVSATRREDPT